jgi:hypothetical protein
MRDQASKSGGLHSNQPRLHSLETWARIGAESVIAATSAASSKARLVARRPELRSTALIIAGLAVAVSAAFSEVAQVVMVAGIVCLVFPVATWLWLAFLDDPSARRFFAWFTALALYITVAAYVGYSIGISRRWECPEKPLMSTPGRNLLSCHDRA